MIKGANASRVEERIARVPADLDASGAGGSIFGALRAMEADAVTGLKAAPKPDPKTVPKAAPKAPAATVKPAPSRSAERSAKAAKIAPEKLPEPKPASAPPAKQGRLGPSDFTAAEREEIVRCCSNYRNQLPIYLLAVQKEVKVIDSVIGKCKKNG